MGPGHIPKRTHSKKGKFQKEHIPKRAHSKNSKFQKQHTPKREQCRDSIVKGCMSKTNFRIHNEKYIPKRAHSKQGTFQRGKIINILQKVANLGQPSLKLHNPTDISLYVADIVRTFMYTSLCQTSVVLTDQKRTPQILRAKTLRVLRQS